MRTGAERRRIASPDGHHRFRCLESATGPYRHCNSAGCIRLFTEAALVTDGSGGRCQRLPSSFIYGMGRDSPSVVREHNRSVSRGFVGIEEPGDAYEMFAGLTSKTGAAC